MVPEVENYIILLLGVNKKPIPTLWHVQKELFILSRVNPKIQGLLGFEKHYEGPYSQILDEIIREPLIFDDAYAYSDSGIHLTQSGKKVFQQLVEKYVDDARFKKLLQAMKLTRSLYDKLEKDRLLFLIYSTFSDYIEFSNVYDKIMDRKFTLAQSLLNKGMVTRQRFEELIKKKKKIG